MRLDKFLSDSACGTRREVKAAVRKGQVTVDGAVITDAAYAVSEKNLVLFCGRPACYTPFIYLMMNKPAGVLSATTDKTGQTVLDLVPSQYRHYRLFPVGRLDKDSEGLLLLTNDGSLSHRSLSPKFHVEKTYYVKTAKPIVPAAETAFREGIVISGGYKTRPAKLVRVSDTSARVTLTEGKFHQIKQMFAALGNEVIYLKRLSFGHLSLDEQLAPGECRLLLPEETVF